MKKGSYFYYALANGMFYYSWGTFACIISVYLAGVGCSATEISLITSAAPLFAIISQPVCGMIADKLKSPKLVGMSCLFLCVISGMLFAYSKNFIFLFLFNGFTQGFFNGTTALSDRLATASPYPFGKIRLWGSVCYAIACQVAGIVYDFVSPMANYYIFAGAIILTLVGFYFMNDVKPVEKDASQQFTIKEMFYSLTKNKAFVLFVVVYILFQGPTSANGVYMPLLIKQLGGTTAMVGTTLLFSTMCEIPIVLFSDRIMKKISYKHLMIFACILSIIRFGWYATCPPPSMIMYMFFFQCLTSIVFILVAVKIIIDIVDEKYVNSAYGISSMLAKGLSALIFQMLSGTIIDKIDGNLAYTVVYLMYAVVILIATLIALKFKMPKHIR
ncbi:MAG: MFS transporter [Coprobacillus sp.]